MRTKIVNTLGAQSMYPDWPWVVSHWLTSSYYTKQYFSVVVAQQTMLTKDLVDPKD